MLRLAVPAPQEQPASGERGGPGMSGGRRRGVAGARSRHGNGAAGNRTGPVVLAGVSALLCLALLCRGRERRRHGVLARGRGGESVFLQWCYPCHRRAPRGISSRVWGEGRGTPEGRRPGDHLGGTGLTTPGLGSQPAECGALIWRAMRSCSTAFPLQRPLASSVQ